MRAERAVQDVEDHVRALVAELGSRIGHQLTPKMQILSRFVGCAAVLLNKYKPQEATWLTACHVLHGREANSERFASVEEREYCMTPTRRRSNTDLRDGMWEITWAL